MEKLEAKMLAQENVITNMELRSDFSLYCVHIETQLVHAYLETLSSILNSLVSLKIRQHSEVNTVIFSIKKFCFYFLNNIILISSLKFGNK